MEPIHFLGVFELQRLAFPPPFDQDILWLPEHLQSHCEKFLDPFADGITFTNPR